jgi:Phage endonuclease I
MTLRSGFERTVDMQLRSSGVPYKNEDTKIPYILECNYNPDFHLLKSNIYIETKGRLLPEERRKHLAVRQQNPEVDLRFVFMYPHKKMQGSKITHAAWATRNGFKWADGRIPEEWLAE